MYSSPKLWVAGLVAAALSTSAVHAQSNTLPCFETEQMQSARIHDLRVMLMVNALKCREVLPRTFSAYGNLMDNRWEELGFHSDQVRDTLSARYGAREGQYAFDNYETRIGNYYSGTVPSVAQCRDVEAFIRLAQRADHGELETLAKLVTNRSISQCRTVRFQPVETAAPALPAPRQPVAPAVRAAPAAPVAAPVAQAIAEPEEELVMVDGIPTYTTPGAGLDTQPEPLEVVELAETNTPVVEAAEPAAPAVAEPTQADRLAQAINALDAAAAALREMQPSAGAGAGTN